VVRLIVYLLLAVGAVASLAPFAWLVRSALMTDEQMFSFPPQWLPSPFAWDNFSGALEAQPLLQYFLNTMLLEVIVVPGVLISTSLAAFSLARLRWRGRGVVFAALMSGLLLPGAATLIPTFIMWQEVGLLNTYFPLTVPAILGAGGAFNVFLLRQFFLTIPSTLDDAAYLDGASPLYVYSRLILPLAKPALILVGVFTFMATWNDLFGPLIYISDSSKFTLALGLASFQSLYSTDWGYLMAASLMVVTPMIIVFFFAQRYILEGVVLTGMKD
jgi:multiple sugar transport system permease protein